MERKPASLTCLSATLRWKRLKSRVGSKPMKKAKKQPLEDSSILRQNVHAILDDRTPPNRRLNGGKDRGADYCPGRSSRQPRGYPRTRPPCGYPKHGPPPSNTACSSTVDREEAALVSRHHIRAQGTAGSSRRPHGTNRAGTTVGPPFG